MTVWVCLLRGINVGGTGKLAMDDLRGHLAALGAEAPETYIQSGNAVFAGDIDAAAFATDLTARIAAAQGHAPRVMVIPGDEVIAAYAAFPFADAFERPKFGNIWFCETAPVAPDLDTLKRLAKESERFALDGLFFHLDAPEGIGRSKLAERVERALGVATTARNLNTVAKLVEMVRARS
ncbi:DUF1697 domain-containing protein [Maritimibacter sp. UBA3975]|uniref:DUF1697 domain-containing protein n=1 Tax=Maritimibacter sp. UBA3975 TaxID=1946833 RepID=UPI000C0B92ED|nr:DUF1697 domain-containing protein [Maritimibacter sp. UBA3975]MAM60192.1 hypothetical protein [Maritimibacter sp.]|tara:strand:- start:2730 stop:3269 length:540 start_codon:yes stop_codon:yes gene_type:complete